MPLGLAKDSMLNLAELASKTDDDSLAEEEHGAANTQHTEGDNENENGTSFRKVIGSDDDWEGQEIEKDDEKNKNGVIEGKESTSTSASASAGDAIKNDGNVSIASNGLIVNNLPSLSISKNIDSDNTNNNTIKSQPSRVEPKTKAKTQQYAGFQADYNDFENYTSYGYFDGDYSASAGSTAHGRKDKKEEVPWWSCIFPFATPHDGDDDDEKDDTVLIEGLTQKGQESTETNDSKVVDKDGNETLMVKAGRGKNNALGEKLLQKDHQADQARLLLAQPDGVDGGSNVSNVVDGISQSGLKSILKHTSKGRDTQSSNNSKGSNSSLKDQEGKTRRSLFPAYEPPTAVKKNLHTTFSPMARVVTIKSSKEMSEQEKANIWWQKANYDEFRKTGRMISRVMLQGGSEVWLATNQSWQVPNQGKVATLRRAIESANNKNETASDKWWHKFGHSRRGLEHIASIDEGRQRQANVKTSIRAVLTEHRRQKVFHREDAEKLRMCCIQNTSWAKDLALASGASDADAVTKNFVDGSRKSREFYLLKFSRAVKLNSSTGPQGRAKHQVMPAFMQPMITMASKNRLDANTTSRLQFQKKEVAKTSNTHKRVTSDVPPVMPTKNGRTRGSVSSVPIHDPIIHAGEESLASKGELSLRGIVFVCFRFVRLIGIRYDFVFHPMLDLIAVYWLVDWLPLLSLFLS